MIKRKISEKDKERIFQLRKSYIEKFNSWNEKVYYGFLIFFGSSIISLVVYNKEAYLIPTGIIAIAFLWFLEGWCAILSSKIYFNLIEDVKGNKIENFKKLNFLNYILCKF